MKTINEENPEKFNKFFRNYFKNNRQTTSINRILQDRYNTAVNELKDEEGGDFFEGRSPKEFAIKASTAINNNPKLSLVEKRFIIGFSLDENLGSKFKHEI